MQGSFIFFLAALKARHPSLGMVFRHHTTTSAYPLDRYQASRCLDYDKAYRRFNSLFLNSDKVKTQRRMVNSPNFLFLILKTKKLCSN